jgi:DNA-binding XRE family transcriptional regulator
VHRNAQIAFIKGHKSGFRALKNVIPNLSGPYWPGNCFGGNKLAKNSLKKIREQLLMSKAELARKAGVSPLTIDRIESGKNCRMETKRKIILALGYSLEDKAKIFGEDD